MCINVKGARKLAPEAGAFTPQSNKAQVRGPRAAVKSAGLSREGKTDPGEGTTGVRIEVCQRLPEAGQQPTAAGSTSVPQQQVRWSC